MGLFGQPISNTAPPFPTTPHPYSPATFFAYSATKRKPTNEWWQNFLVGTGGQTVSTMPYIQKALPKGIHITYPLRTVQPLYILLNPSVKNITLEVDEAVSTREILDYDDMSVRTRWNVSGGSMVVDLVRGQAFNSGKFTNATPHIDTTHAISQVNGATPSTITGTKFKLTMNNGQTWLVYASTAIEIAWTTAGGTATSKFNGFLQLAVLTEPTQEAVYDETGSFGRVTGGHFDATFSGNTSTMFYQWSSEGTAPLMFTQPHHRETLTSPTYTSLQLRGIKGMGVAVKASSWSGNETLTTTLFGGDETLSAGSIIDIKAAIATDKSYIADYDNNGNGVDPYFTGKWVTKMARIMLIADQVGETAAATQVRNNLKPIIQNWFTGALQNDLKYETTWGGVVTDNGLADPGADFGGGRYNDHHFHWGYWIYAAAAVAKDDPTFYTTVRPYIEALIRDIMNPSTGDTYFPRFRHKDWYDGHSSAAGLFEFGDGRNQESTSEAINGWYACVLWADVAGNDDLKDTARLHLAQEIRATKRYWHIYSPDAIYDAPFNTKSTVGILWSTKVDAATFFGLEAYKRVGIQVLPFSPITPSYLDAGWLTRAVPDALTGMPSENGWESISYGLQAAQSPELGYENLFTAVRDDGASKTNDLWWAASRGAAGGIDPDPDPDPEPVEELQQIATYTSRRLQ